MGNKQGRMAREEKIFHKKIKKTATKSKNIGWFVDNIATNFILTTEFQSLLQLQDKTNCSKFAVLTKELIKNKFTPREILYLDHRTKNGNLVKVLTRDDFAIIDNTHLDKLDITNAVKKNRICIGIAEFYVQFFHLFASIVKVINPVYRYKDATNNVVEIDLLKKMNIPKGAEKRRVLLNVCQERLKSLTPIQNTKQGTHIMGKFCGDEVKSICDEPGIQELKKLYFDEYDYDPESPTAGTYYRMSKPMKELYVKDVREFYMEFTGNTTVPEHIKDFCDITTLDVADLLICSDENKFNIYKGTGKELSLKNYGNHIRKMMKNTKENQEKLIEVLDKMFHYDVDPIKKTKALNIHPELKLKQLKELIITTRKTILKIFIDCENDYKKGIQLYRAITLDKKLIQEQRKIKYHKKIRNKLIMQQEDVLHDTNEPIIDSPVSSVSPVNKVNIEETSMKDEEYLEETSMKDEKYLETPLFVR